MILEMVDNIELELELELEPVITEEQVEINGWICKYCNKLLKTKDKNRHYITNKCLEERTRRGLL